MPEVIMLGGVLVSVFWMVVGWRAMRAHEQLAQSVSRLAPKVDLFEKQP